MIVYNVHTGPIFISWDPDRVKGAWCILPGQGLDLELVGLMPPCYGTLKLSKARETYIRATLDSHLQYTQPDCDQAVDYQEHMPDVLAELDLLRKAEIARLRKGKK